MCRVADRAWLRRGEKCSRIRLRFPIGAKIFENLIRKQNQQKNYHFAYPDSFRCFRTFRVSKSHILRIIAGRGLNRVYGGWLFPAWGQFPRPRKCRAIIMGGCAGFARPVRRLAQSLCLFRMCRGGVFLSQMHGADGGFPERPLFLICKKPGFQ